MKTNSSEFTSSIQKSYKQEIPHIRLGSAFLNGEILKDAEVNIPLKMLNRHGLIAGATGSGKTRTLQLFAEQLSDAGVAVFMTDIKGDLGGMMSAGAVNPKLTERAESLGITFEPTEYPVEFYSLSGKKGAQMRATILEFGPILLSKILELNDTQTGVLSLLFKYADDKGLPIVDLKDLKKLLQYLTEGEGANEIKADYGKISSSTSGTILRKIVALEQQGVEGIFGEPSFDYKDLFQKIDGKGVISMLDVSDVQDKPDLFSTFLLSLLAEIYQNLPEAGDLDKPKLVFFLDEAHLLFNDASKAFMEQIEQVIRLIRSKGVGIYFCTQMPSDVPDSVLGQLATRVQHVLRAFTPNDVKALKETVNAYPKSEFYEIDKVLTSLGIGQALITTLNEKGIPTEVAAVHLCPPKSVMGPADESLKAKALASSELYAKYKTTIDRESAYEILSKKIEVQTEIATQEAVKSTVKPSSKRQEKSVVEEVLSSPVAKQIGKEIVRGLFGMLFGSSKKR